MLGRFWCDVNFRICHPPTGLLYDVVCLFSQSWFPRKHGRRRTRNSYNVNSRKCTNGWISHWTQLGFGTRGGILKLWTQTTSRTLFAKSQLLVISIARTKALPVYGPVYYVQCFSWSTTPNCSQTRQTSMTCVWINCCQAREIHRRPARREVHRGAPVASRPAQFLRQLMFLLMKCFWNTWL